MFILKREDVEISTIMHPKREQQIPILYYQEQTFRLVSVFPASQEEEARALWRELTDNRGKACVLLEEVERYSVWGKVRLGEQISDTGSYSNLGIVIQATMLILQGVYVDIEDFLGVKQATLFEKDIAKFLSKQPFNETNSLEAVKHLLNFDPLESSQLPSWQEKHITKFLEELHRLGKTYFGSTNFAHPVVDKLQDMPKGERSLFIMWLSQSKLDKMWN
ncbi:MAG: Npun_F0813 family protein [Cyanobacteria bacterium P01_A01_bin.84]